MRALPDRQREVLALRYYLDLSEAEIAETLGIARGSVKAHASRGAATLRCCSPTTTPKVTSDGRPVALLHDAVADVEPADRLGEIRAAVAASGARVGRYAAGGTMLAAAAVVTGDRGHHLAGRLLAHRTTPARAPPRPTPPRRHPVEASTTSATRPRVRACTARSLPTRARTSSTCSRQSPADPDYRTAWAPRLVRGCRHFDGPAPGQIDVTIADAAARPPCRDDRGRRRGAGDRAGDLHRPGRSGEACPCSSSRQQPDRPGARRSDLGPIVPRPRSTVPSARQHQRPRRGSGARGG